MHLYEDRGTAYRGLSYYTYLNANMLSFESVHTFEIRGSAELSATSLRSGGHKRISSQTLYDWPHLIEIDCAPAMIMSNESISHRFSFGKFIRVALREYTIFTRGHRAINWSQSLKWCTLQGSGVQRIRSPRFLRTRFETGVCDDLIKRCKRSLRKV